MQRWTIFLVLLPVICAKRHELSLSDDARQAIMVSQFGYLAGGSLSVNIELSVPHLLPLKKFGFTLDRASKLAWDPLYMDSKPEECVIKESKKYENLSVIFMVVNSQTHSLDVFRGASTDVMGVNILYATPSFTNATLSDSLNKYILSQLRDSFLRGFKNISQLSFDNALSTTENIMEYIQNSSLLELANTHLTDAKTGLSTLRQVMIKEMLKQGATFPSLSDSKSVLVQLLSIPDILPHPSSISFPLSTNSSDSVSIKLLFEFPTPAEEDMYTLYFHNCERQRNVRLVLKIIESNKSGYLSAGEQPLPLLMFLLCGVYIVLGFIWFFYLKTSKHAIFKTHYLMLVLVFMKSFSLIFHGINYYVLGKYGLRDETWKILFYITHLLKGALMFITVILVGAGWTFVRRILSEREKKLFMVIIPLQILANVATIIIDESEEGTVRNTTWKEIFILVDLLCCGAILFPIIWSIRQMQAAAETDGKAAFNLRKMKLFRQFYVMIICYIYFSRIVVYLLNITVSFRYSWIVELFGQGVTMFFFILTGYMFRPVTENPYFQLTQDEEEADTQERLELEQVWSQSGSRDGITRVNNVHAFAAEDSGEETDVMYVAAPKRDQVQHYP